MRDIKYITGAVFFIRLSGLWNIRKIVHTDQTGLSNIKKTVFWPKNRKKSE